MAMESKAARTEPEKWTSGPPAMCPTLVPSGRDSRMERFRHFWYLSHSASERTGQRFRICSQGFPTYVLGMAMKRAALCCSEKPYLEASTVSSTTNGREKLSQVLIWVFMSPSAVTRSSWEGWCVDLFRCLVSSSLPHFDFLDHRSHVAVVVEGDLVELAVGHRVARLLDIQDPLLQLLEDRAFLQIGLALPDERSLPARANLFFYIL